MSLPEELTVLCARLSAHEACLNLMGKHAYYETAFRLEDLLSLWSRREDCMICTPWGVYDGFDGVARYYTEDGYGDRNNPAHQEQLKGLMINHEVDTTIVEVDADACTARAAWISPGHETIRSGECFWCWTKAAADFIFENGDWKFWKLRFYPIFKTPYEKPWTESKIDYSEIAKSKHPDRPMAEPVWAYGEPYPLHEPEPPLPYAKYDGCQFYSEVKA